METILQSIHYSRPVISLKYDDDILLIHCAFSTVLLLIDDLPYCWYCYSLTDILQYYPLFCWWCFSSIVCHTFSPVCLYYSGWQFCAVFIAVIHWYSDYLVFISVLCILNEMTCWEAEVIWLTSLLSTIILFIVCVCRDCLYFSILSCGIYSVDRMCLFIDLSPYCSIPFISLTVCSVTSLTTILFYLLSKWYKVETGCAVDTCCLSPRG